MLNKDEIVNLLYNQLEHVYCDTCDFQEVGWGNECDYCNRREMGWKISKEYCEKLAGIICGGK